MLGWINDCVEKLVLEKFGVDAWHTIKLNAGCDVADGAFLKLEHYSDASTINLVTAASEVAGLTVPQVLETFGTFFVHYIRDEGYENLLCCQGSTLRDWCGNINAIHHHLQTTFPKAMTMPLFWVTDGDDNNGSLVLHYHSKRGNLFAPLAKGIVVEIAKFQFGVDIRMDLNELQGENGSDVTSWSVNAVDPSQQWKLKQNEGMRNGKKNAPTALKCPFTGMTVPSAGQDDPPKNIEFEKCPSSSSSNTLTSTTASSSGDDCLSVGGGDGGSQEELAVAVSAKTVNSVGLSSAVTKALFPYSVVIDEDFSILQIGQNISKALKLSEEEIFQSQINDVLEITKPMNVEWNWEWMRKLEDQSFQLEPILGDGNHSSILFKASIVLISNNPTQAMLIMSPDAQNLDELMEMNLTLSDLPVHGDYRDAIFLREHLSTQMNNALKMEKLSKSLQREKQLLESLLPEHAAEGLRAGRTVEPRMHQNVSFFFSDIVGFTNICKDIYPWDVIGMLNRLYCVMDFLAIRFRLFKVETIGDAYVCCSGLPHSDENHAENVANFAIAVSHCCRQVLSPVSKEPIQLRIGMHTGPAASGVVGTTNPRYCVFGDTVNTTARHESTGAPGKIHCSKVTVQEIQQRNDASNYSIVERGMIEMKGKGEQLTYWLTSSEDNELVNQAALEKLDAEVQELLAKTDFDAATDSQAPTEDKVPLDGLIEAEVSRRATEATGSSKATLSVEHDEDKGQIREAVPVSAPPQSRVPESAPPQSPVVVGDTLTEQPPLSIRAKLKKKGSNFRKRLLVWFSSSGDLRI